MIAWIKCRRIWLGEGGGFRGLGFRGGGRVEG